MIRFMTPCTPATSPAAGAAEYRVEAEATRILELVKRQNDY